MYYRFSGMPLPALKNNIGVQVDDNDNVTVAMIITLALINIMSH